MNKIVFLFLLLTAGSMAGCASGRWVGKPVIEDQYIKISLEHRVVDDAVVNPQYRHPYHLEPDRMKQLLSGLAYQESAALLGKPKTEPVFQDVELLRLAPGISEALAAAAPHERILFTSFNKGGGLLFAKRRINQGVMFIDPEDMLNIAFTCINCEIQPDETLYRSSDPLQRDPLEITKTDRPLVFQRTFTDIHTDAEGNPHPMWAVVDLDGFIASIKAVPVDPAPAEPSETREPGLRAPAPEAPRTSDAPVISADPEPEQTEPGMQAPPEPGGSDRDEQKDRIKREFSILKELHDENLITSEEYESRKSRLLDQLTNAD